MGHKETILEEAHRITRGDRAKEYGPVQDNIDDIARLWDLYIRMRLRELAPGLAPVRGVITAHDVCQLIVLQKVARTTSGYHRDSAVDVAGYAALQEILGDLEAQEQYMAEAHGKKGDA